MAKKPKSSEMSAIGRKMEALERPENIRLMIIGLAVLCALLFIADFFHLRHGKFESENLIGFYGIAGFAAFAFIIFSTKVLKALLSKPDNYYSPNVVDDEAYPEDGLEKKQFEEKGSSNG